MAKIILATVLCISTPAFAQVVADAELRAAKNLHAKEVAKLRENLIVDIEAAIKMENDRGAGIDYLLKEKTGFVDNGVLPILPKLLPASQRYMAGKRSADEQLAKAYLSEIAAATKAGESKRATELRNEMAALKEPKLAAKKGTLKPLVAESKSELRNVLAGTTWW